MTVRQKVHLILRKSATKFFCVNAVRNRVVKHLVTYLPLPSGRTAMLSSAEAVISFGPMRNSYQKSFVGDVLFYVKIWWKLADPLFINTDFQSIFARSASAVTPSKEVQLHV